MMNKAFAIATTAMIALAIGGSVVAANAATATQPTYDDWDECPYDVPAGADYEAGVWTNADGVVIGYASEEDECVFLDTPAEELPATTMVSYHIAGTLPSTR